MLFSIFQDISVFDRQANTNIGKYETTIDIPADLIKEMFRTASDKYLVRWSGYLLTEIKPR